MKVKAPATSPDEIPCKGCGAVFNGPVITARSRGWKVGWQPGHPSWCPDCWKTPLPLKRSLGVGEGYMEPTLFDTLYDLGGEAA